MVSSIIALVLLGIGLAAPFDLLSPAAQRALGVTVCAVILWTARPIPIELTSLLLLLLIPLAGLLSFKETFQPFANPTVWLVFAGLVLSLALCSSGPALAARARSRPEE
ncbi:MAG: anion permease, partial [Gemmatimonadetes bacterium]|nr:anion permease [Gemmatimonadota bacterium]